MSNRYICKTKAYRIRFTSGGGPGSNPARGRVWSPYPSSPIPRLQVENESVKGSPPRGHEWDGALYLTKHPGRQKNLLGQVCQVARDMTGRIFFFMPSITNLRCVCLQQRARKGREASYNYKMNSNNFAHARFGKRGLLPRAPLLLLLRRRGPLLLHLPPGLLPVDGLGAHAARLPILLPQVICGGK